MPIPLVSTALNSFSTKAALTRCSNFSRWPDVQATNALSVYITFFPFQRSQPKWSKILARTNRVLGSGGWRRAISISTRANGSYGHHRATVDFAGFRYTGSRLSSPAAMLKRTGSKKRVKSEWEGTLENPIRFKIWVLRFSMCSTVRAILPRHMA